MYKELESKIGALYLPYFLFLFFGFFYLALSINSYPVELKVYLGWKQNYLILIAIYFVAIFFAAAASISRQRESFETLTSFKFFIYFLIFSFFLNICMLSYSVKTIKPSETFRNDLSKAVTFYREDDSKLDIDILQDGLKCCGLASYKDYFKVENPKLPHKLPISCCKLKEEGYYCSERFVYKQGCYSVYKDNLNKFRKLVLTTLSVSSLIQLTTIVLFYYFISSFSPQIAVTKVYGSKA